MMGDVRSSRWFDGFGKGALLALACACAACMALVCVGAATAHADDVGGATPEAGAASAAGPAAEPAEIEASASAQTSVLTVTSAGDGAGEGTLRWALAKVNEGAGNRIEFDVAAMGGSVVEIGGELPAVKRAVVIDGAPSGVTIRKAPEAGLADGWRHLRIGNAQAPSFDVTISQVAFEGPGTEGAALGVENGGIFAGEDFAGALALERCVLEGNVNECGNADPSSEKGFGGAVNIWSDEASLRMTGCTVQSNVAFSFGGGVYSLAPVVAEGCTFVGNSSMGERPGGGALLSADKAELTRCRIEGNLSEGDSGGVQSGVLTMTDCTVRENKAGGEGSLATGGGVGAVDLVMTNCQVERNACTGAGGGVYSSFSVVATGCTVSGNRSDGLAGGMYIARQGTVSASELSENTSSDVGGAIVVGDETGEEASELKLADTALRQNEGSAGGGIFMYVGCELVLENAVLAKNRAALTGGAVYGEESAALSAKGCEIGGNSAAADGGGVYLENGEASLQDCIVAENTAQGNGGGVFARGLVVDGSQFARNQARGAGGGVYADFFVDANASVFEGNTALSGGGAQASDARFVNCTMSGNAAEKAGGGLLASVAKLEHCTVSGNTVGTDASATSFGGGVCAEELSMNGSLVSGNHTGAGASCEVQVGDALDNGTGTVSDDHGKRNIVGVPAGGLQALMATETVNGVQVGALADNGGATKTIMITPDGPAQDAVVSGDYDVPTVDQRGDARPFGAAADIGAVEVSGLALEYAVTPFGTYRGESAPLSGEVSAPLRSALSVEVSGAPLKAGEHYTLAEGSTKITLLPAYLKTLENGTYEVEVAFTNGRGKVPLAVELAVAKPKALARTGDGAAGPLVCTVALAVAAAAATAVSFARRRVG